MTTPLDTPPPSCLSYETSVRPRTGAMLSRSRRGRSCWLSAPEEAAAKAELANKTTKIIERRRLKPQNCSTSISCARAARGRGGQAAVSDSASSVDLASR
jgi:hypothetical protein